jgi:hypothetical protein
MRDKIIKWWNREWSNWEIYKEDYKQDINYETNWKMITTLRRTSNDGLIQYKTIRNY